MEQTAQTNLFELQLDQLSINFLGEAARWGRFLAILGFIGCGFIALMVLIVLFFGSYMGTMIPGMPAEAGALGSFFFGFMLICAGLLIIFPALFLYKFSVKMRRALNNNDQPVLTESFRNLKSLFKFHGILMIISLSLYALAFIAGVFGAILGRH